MAPTHTPKRKVDLTSYQQRVVEQARYLSKERLSGDARSDTVSDSLGSVSIPPVTPNVHCSCVVCIRESIARGESTTITLEGGVFDSSE